jgi:tetratricopeptide (TPR) repeat protein
MEYAEGGSFREWLVQNRENVARRRTEGVAHIVQACRGLEVLHAAGIIHLDLKPENLLLFGDVLKVADLGLSRWLRRRNPGEAAERDGQEQCRTGTPAYMSREQFLRACAARVDERSDIYSIGAVLFEACDERCRPLFVGTYEQVREAHLRMPAPRVKGVETHIAHVIQRCLQRDPGDRYGSVSELITDLENPSLCQTERMAIGHRISQIELWWRQACDFVRGRDLNSAGRTCRAILQARPDHEDAQYMLQDIENRFEQARQFYAALQRGIGVQSFDRLLPLLAAAVEIYPDHPEGALVQTQLLSLMREYRPVMRRAKQAFRRGQCEEALDLLATAARLNPGDPAVTEAIAVVREVQRHIQMTRANIAAALEQGNRQKAILLARHLDRYIEQNTALTRQLPPSELDHDTNS